MALSHQARVLSFVDRVILLPAPHVRPRTCGAAGGAVIIIPYNMRSVRKEHTNILIAPSQNEAIKMREEYTEMKNNLIIIKKGVGFCVQQLGFNCPVPEQGC